MRKSIMQDRCALAAETLDAPSNLAFIGCDANRRSGWDRKT
jgi:hypothetical protein